MLADTDARIRAREDAELDDLGADERERDEAEHRVDLPRAAEDVDRAGRKREHPAEAEREQSRAGVEVEPARAVQEHEPDVAPGVAEAVQLRLADARVVVDRDLAHDEVAPVCLEDHLRRELHPGGVEFERLKRALADGPHAAVRVRHLHAEEEVEHPREDRISDEAVEERHRVPVDRPLEAGADDEIVACLEAVDERSELLERIRLVGIAHHDVVAARLGQPGEVRAAVASARSATTRAPCASATSAERSVEPLSTTITSPGPSRTAYPVQRLVDDSPDGFLLVQAGDDDGNLRCLRRHRESTLAGRAVASASVTVSRRVPSSRSSRKPISTRFARRTATRTRGSRSSPTSVG